MGGWGSGQRYGYTKRLVEDCHILSINTIKDKIKDIDSKGGIYFGSVYWTCGGERVADINFRIIKQNSLLNIQLIYQSKSRFKEEVIKSDYRVQLQVTYPNFGGKRYWFTCPLVVGGVPCLRRVGKLYLPPESIYFGCRHCYDLAYLSSRESHKWDNMWLSLGFDPSIQKLFEREYTR